MHTIDNRRVTMTGPLMPPRPLKWRNWDTSRLEFDQRKRRRNLARVGSPTIAILGSSHVTRWRNHLLSTDSTPVEKGMTRNCHLLGAGGAYTNNLFDLLSWDKSLSPYNYKKQEKEGNQIQKLQDKHLRIEFGILAIGSNDVDQARHYLEQIEASGDREELRATMELEAMRITLKIKDCLKEMENIMPHATLIFLNIMPRDSWGQTAMQLATKVNEEVEVMLKVRTIHNHKDTFLYTNFVRDIRDDILEPKEFPINSAIFNDDGTHLNYLGYCALTRVAICSTWDRKIQTRLHGAKRRANFNHKYMGPPSKKARVAPPPEVLQSSSKKYMDEIGKQHDKKVSRTRRPTIKDSRSHRISPIRTPRHTNDKRTCDRRSPVKKPSERRGQSKNPCTKQAYGTRQTVRITSDPKRRTSNTCDKQTSAKRASPRCTSDHKSRTTIACDKQTLDARSPVRRTIDLTRRTSSPVISRRRPITADRKDDHSNHTARSRQRERGHSSRPSRDLNPSRGRSPRHHTSDRRVETRTIYAESCSQRSNSMTTHKKSRELTPIRAPSKPRVKSVILPKKVNTNAHTVKQNENQGRHIYRGWRPSNNTWSTRHNVADDHPRSRRDKEYKGNKYGRR